MFVLTIVFMAVGNLMYSYNRNILPITTVKHILKYVEMILFFFLNNQVFFFLNICNSGQVLLELFKRALYTFIL